LAAQVVVIVVVMVAEAAVEAVVAASLGPQPAVWAGNKAREVQAL
jgi:hypothetical protein